MKQPTGLTYRQTKWVMPPTLLEDLAKGHSTQWSGERYGDRKTIDYGWSFPDLDEGRDVFRPLPESLKEVRRFVYSHFSDLVDHLEEDYDNVIVNDYREGDHLPAHIDRDNDPRRPDFLRHYKFGEVILGLIAIPDETGHLYFSHESDLGKPLCELPEETGTVFAMNAEARHYPYFHGVSQVSKTRLSFTFRVVVMEGAAH